MASSTYKISIEGDATSLKNATGQAEDALGGLDESVKKTTGGKDNDPLEPIGKKIDKANLMAAAGSVAEVGDKVLDLGKKSIEAAAEQNAMNSTFKQTFGDLTPFATSEVNKLSKAYDILPNRIKPSYQQFTAMFKGLGLSTQDAAGKATQAMRISANAAAFYDKSLEDSNSALQSFVKGNYEGGESIGLFANDTQMAAFAAKNNLIPATEGAKQASEELLVASEKANKKLQDAIKKHGENSIEAREASLKLKDVQDKISEELGPQQQKWADLDEATKQAARLEYAENMMQQAGAIDEVGKMAGQASRESGEYENQMGNMNQTIQDLYATIGKDILPTFLAGLQKGIEIVKGIAKAFEGLPEPVKQFIFIFGGLIALLSQIAPLIAAIVTVVTTVGAAPIAIVLAIIAVVSALVVAIQNWGSIMDWVTEKWNTFVTWGKELWSSFTTWLGELWSEFKTNLGATWDAILAALSAIWNVIKQLGIAVFETIVSTIVGKWQFLQNTTIAIWNAIQTVISTVWNAIKAVVSAVVGAIVSIVTGAWNGIKNITSTIWNGIKSFISAVWDGIKSITTSVVNSLSGAISNAWNAIKNITNSVWNAIKATIINLITGAKDGVMNISNTIKNGLSGAWNAVKNTASNMWNAIKSAITSPFESAWNVISGIVDKIKSAFNFNLEFPRIQIPHIPLPHFSMEGEFSPLEGKFPGFSVNWYKTGGVFSDPSVIGVGEAGKEAVLPLKDKVLGTIGSMIAKTITTDQLSGANSTPAVTNITIDWQGDIDSDERLNQLADEIDYRFARRSQNNGFR